MAAGRARVIADILPIVDILDRLFTQARENSDQDNNQLLVAFLEMMLTEMYKLLDQYHEEADKLLEA
jgi:molecular chaperone GrpE (heat shock protein)